LVYPIAGTLAALAALAMPRAELVTVNVVQAARRLLRDGRWARFLISAMLIGCSAALMHGFFSLYMEDLGAGGEQIGLAYTIASKRTAGYGALGVRTSSLGRTLVNDGRRFRLRHSYAALLGSADA
jgi:4-amino-4-deoxy-L-arabinose transferase-like glycosyltransferase